MNNQTNKDESNVDIKQSPNGFSKTMSKIGHWFVKIFKAIGNFFKTLYANKNRNKRMLCIALTLIIVGACCASLVLHDGGDITITTITIPTQDGQWVTADLFKPLTATKDNKAPCIVVCPGFQRSKETQTSMSLEFARRGTVVICIDPYAQGDSSSSNQAQSATTEGYGIIPMVDYIYDTDNLNYIDKTRIGAAGHSAGGNAALRAAAYYGTQSIDSKKPSKLHSIYVSGYVITFTDSVLANVNSNIGMGYAYYDEGAYRNENANTEYADADMRYAPEALRVVNSGLKANKQPTITEVVIGEIYGKPSNRSLRVVNNEKVLHALQPYDPISISHTIDFFDISFGLDSGLAITNQTWWIKELFQLMMLVGAFIGFANLGALLLKTKSFESLVHPLPAPAPKQSKTDKAIFWSVFAVGALIACFLYIPLSKAAQVWFPTAQSGQQTWFFPQRMNNAVMLWAVANGLIGMAIFFVVHFLRNRKPTGNVHALEGAKIGFAELCKTVLLALVIFAAYYVVDFTCFHLLHVDFRFMFISAKPLTNINLIKVAAMYIPFFLIFYISNSLRVNCSMRVTGWSETKSTLIACLANSVGLMLIMAIQYVTFASTGTVYWTDEWLYVNILFSLIPMMFVLPILQRFFFNKTGKIYLGAIVCCMIFIMMMTTNTVCYIPLAK